MESYLRSVLKQYKYYKAIGDKTFEQLEEGQLFWQPNSASNSIAMIANHMAGNMLSRWTNFLEEDGEKPWRKRDQEFEDIIQTKAELLTRWEEGWQCLFAAIVSLTQKDLEREIYIRNVGHTVIEAINRQLAHYPYHIGQIVFIGKLFTGDDWESLSIPKGQSKAYNAEKFSKPKRKGDFTDDL